MRLFPAILVLLVAPCLTGQVRLPAKDPDSSPFYPAFSDYQTGILKGKIRHIAYCDLKVYPDSNRTRYPGEDIFGIGARFDEHGNMIYETIVSDGEEKIFREYLYDSQLRLTKTLSRRFGMAEDSIIYNDAESRITRYQGMGRLSDTTFIRYRFDKNGNLISLAKNYPVGINGLSYEITYEYDSKNRVIKEVKKDFPYVGKGNAAGKDTIANSKRTLIHEYFEKDDVEVETIYKQKEVQRQIEKENINYLKKGTKVTREYSHDGATRTDSVVTTDTGTIRYSFRYNEQHIYKVTHFNERESVTAIFFTERPDDNETFQYELDKMGNWVELRRFINGKLYTVRRRIIEYFE